MSRRRPEWPPIFRPNGRPNKDLEHVSDSIFYERALGSVDIQRSAMIVAAIFHVAS